MKFAAYNTRRNYTTLVITWLPKYKKLYDILQKLYSFLHAHAE